MARRKTRTVSTPQELAAACNVGRSTAYRWVQDGCPRNQDGTFDVDVVAEWARRRRSESASRAPADEIEMVHDLGTGKVTEMTERAHADVTYRKIRTALAALELKKRKGDVIEREKVAELLARRAVLFRRRFDAMRRRLPLRLAGVNDPREIDSVLSLEFDELLSEAYGAGPQEEADDDVGKLALE